MSPASLKMLFQMFTRLWFEPRPGFSIFAPHYILNTFLLSVKPDSHVFSNLPELSSFREFNPFGIVGTIMRKPFRWDICGKPYTTRHVKGQNKTNQQ